MNKQVFMGSMIDASETIMKIGITGDAQQRFENTLMTAADAMEEGEEREAAIKKVNDESWGVEVSKKAEEAFILVQKNIRAFYMANNKAKWTIIGYDDNLEVFLKVFGVIGSTSDWKVNIVNLANILKESLDVNVNSPRVSHDNGAAWKKTKTDLKRFDTLDGNVKDFKEIVS